MAKTTYGPGVIVTSKWLNGAQKLYFDGQDLDWHYAPINLGDIQRGGVLGFDSGYVTLDSDQVYSTTPVYGAKTFMGYVEFGNAIFSNPAAAPMSFSTNAKFDKGGTTQDFSVKYANLANADLVTKYVLQAQLDNFPIIDQGFF